MDVVRGDGRESHGWLRRGLARVTGVALGIALLGTIGLSGTLAQTDDVAAGTDAESIVNSIIEQVFAEIFGGAVVDDTADSGGDLNIGGSTGSTVTMGGGDISIGGGATVDDASGG
jgi:hypothetical protein